MVYKKKIRLMFDGLYLNNINDPKKPSFLQFCKETRITPKTRRDFNFIQLSRLLKKVIYEYKVNKLPKYNYLLNQISEYFRLKFDEMTNETAKKKQMFLSSALIGGIIDQ